MIEALLIGLLIFAVVFAIIYWLPIPNAGRFPVKTLLYIIVAVIVLLWLFRHLP